MEAARDRTRARSPRVGAVSAYREKAEVEPLRPLTEEEMQEDPEVAKTRLEQQGETARARHWLIGAVTLIVSGVFALSWDSHEKTLQKEADARSAVAASSKAKDEAVKAMFDEVRTQEQLKDDWIKGGCSGRFQDPSSWTSGAR